MDNSTHQSNTDTVFIIKKDKKVRESVTLLVKSMGIEYECFDSAEEFLADLSPDLNGCIVTDYRMMGMNGIELLEELSIKDSALAVVILTADGSIPIAVKAIQSGAITLLEELCSENELWQAIRNALKTNHSRLKRKHERGMRMDAIGTLTHKERDVLELVVEGLNNKQIAKNLDIGLRTVEARRHQIKQKLGVKSTIELVRFYDRACINA